MSQSDFLLALGWAVLNSFWQLALLWALYQVWSVLFPKSTAAVRSAMATGMLLAGFGWFLLTFFTLLAADTPSVANAFPYIYGTGGWNNWIRELLPAASVIYLLLLIIPVSRFIRNYRYVQAIRTHALHKADVKWRVFVQKLSGQMGIRKKVELWVSDLVQSPVTIGYLRPVILLPVAAVSHLSPEQVEAVLLHELAHIRRFDYLMNLLIRFIQTLLYFNPFVKAFVRIIETERENSCDEMVIQFQYDAHGYASALLTLEQATGMRQQALAVAASGSRKHQLLGRVQNIMGVKQDRKVTGMRFAGIMLALLCLAGMHVLLQWKKPSQMAEGDSLYAYTASPYLFFADGKASQTREIPYAIPATVPRPEDVSGKPQPEVPATKSVAAVSIEDAVNSALALYVDNDNEHTGIAPHLFQFIADYTNVLSAEQEADVEKALNESQRVLEAIQWKAVEKTIADALTTGEKELLRLELQQAAKQADWNRAGEKLRQAYTEIDWPQLNANLEMAMSEIRLDSLQQVYNKAAQGLEKLQKEFAATQTRTIPDTEITLEGVIDKHKQVEERLRAIRKVQERKVIKL